VRAAASEVAGVVDGVFGDGKLEGVVTRVVCDRDARAAAEEAAASELAENVRAFGKDSVRPETLCASQDALAFTAVACAAAALCALCGCIHLAARCARRSYARASALELRALGLGAAYDDDDDDEAAERRRPPRRRPKQKLRGASNRRPASKRRGAAAADDGESSGTEVEEVDDDDVERARRPAAATTRQWRPLRGQEGTSDHTRRVLELAGLPQRHRGGFEL
jgi:hypothetical protein